MKELVCTQMLTIDFTGLDGEPRQDVHSCKGKMLQTDWRPDKPQDPKLRQYKCKTCGYKEYLVDDNEWLRNMGIAGGKC